MNQKTLKWLCETILKTPLLVWALAGFFISYLFFFICPIFFSAPVMQFFKYVQESDSIAIDLKWMLSYSNSWFVARQTPYIGNNLYPPLASVLFTPFLALDFSWAYKIVTLVSVFSYIMITFIFPLRISKEKRASALLMLVFISGLLSYGFQFELERGQFNVFTVFICFLAIWIYHFHPRYRFLAYILFTLSVQLKIYPFIFIVMFISNWQDWKNNLKRLLILAFSNFALFFILGPYIFVDFVRAILSQILYPFVWTGNHSIHAFIIFFSSITDDHGRAWINQNSGLLEIILQCATVVCIFLVMFQCYRQKQNGINPFLLLACTIGALLIPSVSNDYKLSILAAPVAIFLTNNRFWEQTNGPLIHIIFIMLLLIFSAAYSSTLFSFTNKPLLLQNNFPALAAMLVVVTILFLLTQPDHGNFDSKQIETT